MFLFFLLFFHDSCDFFFNSYSSPLFLSSHPLLTSLPTSAKLVDAEKQISELKIKLGEAEARAEAAEGKKRERGGEEEVEREE